MMTVTAVRDVTPSILQHILRDSLASPNILVTNITHPESLDDTNIQFASELSKIVVTIQEEDGNHRTLHLVVKEALQSSSAWSSVIFGLFIFYRECFWFDSALPELLRLVKEDQAASLMEVVPKVHHAYCNYQEMDRRGCILRRAVTCCCCVLMTKPKEKGIIIMENLKQGGEDIFVDLKEVERTSGGGVKSAHMRKILKGLAHFHGAWSVWLRRGKGMGDMTKDQMMKFFHIQYRWKWMWKLMIKKLMNNYVVFAEHKGEQTMKEKLDVFRNSPLTVERFMKTFDYKESKFQTMCHSDLHTAQIMISLNEDGSPKKVKILDFQGLTLGHPAMDIWSIVYSVTDSEYRMEHMEADLEAYYDILAGYLETKGEYTEFRQELEERRVQGMVMYGKFCFLSLSPTKLPSPVKEPSKYSAACQGILTAEETPEDHPDIKEIRRRVMGNMKEVVELDLIKYSECVRPYNYPPSPCLTHPRAR